MIRNSKTRFSKTIRYYDLYRPSYPEDLINWIIGVSKLTPFSKIADIGCGTGISTRLFAKKGFNIIGIDPNEDMLAYAQKRNGKVIYQKGDAENTKLANHSIDLIISAQAFHWFNIDRTMKELKRILKIGGFCCAFWNIREKTPFLKAYNKVLKKFSKDYENTPTAKETIIAIKKNENATHIQEIAFPYAQSFNLGGLVGRAYSTSYVTSGVKDHNAFKQALSKIFEKHKSRETVEFRYQTTAVCWQFQS